MTKEELLTALNAQLGTNPNLSERTISTFADQMASAMGEDFVMTDEFVQKQADVLKSMSGQLSHDIAAGIEEWKKKNTIAPSTDPPDVVNVPDVDELSKKLAALQARIDGEENKAKLAAYRADLKKLLKTKLGEGANDYILDDVVNSGDWDTSKTADAVVGDAEKTYNAKYKKCFGNGPAPVEATSGSGSGLSDAQKARRAAFVAKLRSRNMLPASENNNK